MKKITLFCFSFFLLHTTFAQIKIHSHNDYTRKNPFFDAYNVKADEIEADIFLVDGKLVVAHSKKEIDTAKTLERLYLNPIAKLYRANGDKISKDKNYRPTLMIDVKDNWDLIYPILEKLLVGYGDTFDRNKNKNAVQVLISGNRPTQTSFHEYPSWLFFDGLPNVEYAKTDLEKIPLISDNFANSSKWKGEDEIPKADVSKLKELINEAHAKNKPIRFWGAPDNANGWAQLIALGVDFINTDKVADCRAFLSKTK